MFWFINQVFITLLCFSRSLAIKCISLNNESFMTRPTLGLINNAFKNLIILKKAFFISGYFTIHNRYYILSFHKT